MWLPVVWCWLGESYEQSASRELAEELGVSGIPLDSRFLIIILKTPLIGCGGGSFVVPMKALSPCSRKRLNTGCFMSVPQILERRLLEPFTPDGILILQQIQKAQP